MADRGRPESGDSGTDPLGAGKEDSGSRIGERLQHPAVRGRLLHRQRDLCRSTRSVHAP